MSACGVCSKPISDGDEVKCYGVCNRVFHAACIKGDGEGVTTRKNKTWKCNDCRQSSASSKSSVSTTALTKEFLIQMFDEFKKEMFNEFKSTRSEMGEMSSSMQFLSDKVDASNTLMNEIKLELVSLKKENTELKEKNEALSKTVSDLRERMRNIEQYSRKNNIELCGVPTTPGEDVKLIVKDLGAALGLEIDSSHIAAAHRVPSYNKERLPSVIVQFYDQSLKESLLVKFREARAKSDHLTADKINKALPRGRVYVNDHLSPENKQFLAKLKSKCKDIGYVFVWCRDGKFFVRKAAGEKVLKVSSWDEIDKLK